MKQATRATQLVFLVFGMGISCWAPMIPFVKGRLDLNEAELGLALLIFGIGAIVTMPFSGWLINRMGSRLLTLVSGLFMLSLSLSIALSGIGGLLALAGIFGPIFLKASPQRIIAE